MVLGLTEVYYSVYCGDRVVTIRRTAMKETERERDGEEVEGKK
jgi:hypothetical protein